MNKTFGVNNNHTLEVKHNYISCGNVSELPSALKAFMIKGDDLRVAKVTYGQVTYYNKTYTECTNLGDATRVFINNDLYTVNVHLTDTVPLGKMFHVERYSLNVENPDCALSRFIQAIVNLFRGYGWVSFKTRKAHQAEAQFAEICTRMNRMGNCNTPLCTKSELNVAEKYRLNMHDGMMYDHDQCKVVYQRVRESFEIANKYHDQICDRISNNIFSRGKDDHFGIDDDCVVRHMMSIASISDVANLSTIDHYFGIYADEMLIKLSNTFRARIYTKIVKSPEKMKQGIFGLLEHEYGSNIVANMTKKSVKHVVEKFYQNFVNDWSVPVRLKPETVLAFYMQYIENNYNDIMQYCKEQVESTTYTVTLSKQRGNKNKMVSYRFKREKGMSWKKF